MNKIKMMSEALEDFRKYKDSKKCRHYNRIIYSLRAIPYGVKNKTDIVEFYQFIPSKERTGIKLINVVKMVLEMWVGYTEASHSKDVKKVVGRLYAAKWYAKNKEKYKKQAKEKYHSDAKYRRRKLKLSQADYRKDPEYRRVRYGAQRAEWRLQNRDRLLRYQANWNKKNKEKRKEYYKQYRIRQQLLAKVKIRNKWV